MRIKHPILTEEGWRYETQHNQHRRHRSHDYTAVGTYLITITVNEALTEKDRSMHAVFGTVKGNPRARKGDRDYASISPSPLGMAVLTEERQKIHKYYPMVSIWHFCLMPDHIHVILRVESALPAKKHLGHVVGAFMGGVSRAWWRLNDDGQRQPLFDEGYNDHILMRDGQLDNWKAYLDDNPHRLLLRQCFPDIMERRLCVTIAGTRYSAFGNFSLLKRPEKVQGYCHVRARYGDLTPEERQKYGYPSWQTGSSLRPDAKTRIPYEQTQHFRDNYTRTMMPVKTASAVLVTPGISKGEQQMKNDAIKEHLPLIHLQQEPIPPRWKPESSRFYACAEGSLLILAPWDEDMHTEGYYATFHKLNELAAAICALDVSELVDCTVAITG